MGDDWMDHWGPPVKELPEESHRQKVSLEHPQVLAKVSDKLMNVGICDTD